MKLNLLPAGLAVTLSVTGCAGKRVTTFSEMDKRVPAGTTVYVTTVGGQEIKGKVVTVAGSSMKISLRDAAMREFSEADVARVRAKDPLWNGILIGAAVGATPAVLLFEPGCVEPFAVPDCKTVSRGAGVAISAGMGAGVGLLWDVLHRRRVFHGAQPARRTSVVIAPVFGSKAAGIRVSSRF